MKRGIVFAVVAVAVLALLGTLVYAQARQGAGCCGMMKPAGQGAGPMAGPGQGAGVCPMMGAGRMAGPGGAWSNTQPLTEEQKAFVEKVRGLHDQIRAKQAEVNTLRARNGNRERIAALDKELQGLRVQLHDEMVKSRDLRMQMANCPMYKDGTCPGPNAACCANCPLKDKCMAANCANCPMRDKCMAQCKQAGAQTCPMQPGKTCPMSKSCPMAKPGPAK